MTQALEGPEKIPLGVLYENDKTPTYEEVDPTIKRHGPAVQAKLGLTPEERQALLQSFM